MAEPNHNEDLSDFTREIFRNTHNAFDNDATVRTGSGKRRYQSHTDEVTSRAKAHRGSSAVNRAYLYQDSSNGWKSAPPGLISSIDVLGLHTMEPERSVTGLQKALACRSMHDLEDPPPFLYQTPPQINATKPAGKKGSMEITPEDESLLHSSGLDNMHDAKRRLGYNETPIHFGSSGQSSRHRGYSASSFPTPSSAFGTPWSTDLHNRPDEARQNDSPDNVIATEVDPLHQDEHLQVDQVDHHQDDDHHQNDQHKDEPHHHEDEQHQHHHHPHQSSSEDTHTTSETSQEYERYAHKYPSQSTHGDPSVAVNPYESFAVPYNTERLSLQHDPTQLHWNFGVNSAHDLSDDIALPSRDVDERNFVRLMNPIEPLGSGYSAMFLQDAPTEYFNFGPPDSAIGNEHHSQPPILPEAEVEQQQQQQQHQLQQQQQQHTHQLRQLQHQQLRHPQYHRVKGEPTSPVDSDSNDRHDSFASSPYQHQHQHQQQHQQHQQQHQQQQQQQQQQLQHQQQQHQQHQQHQQRTMWSHPTQPHGRHHVTTTTTTQVHRPNVASSHPLHHHDSVLRVQSCKSRSLANTTNVANAQGASSSMYDDDDDESTETLFEIKQTAQPRANRLSKQKLDRKQKVERQRAPVSTNQFYFPQVDGVAVASRGMSGRKKEKIPNKPVVFPPLVIPRPSQRTAPKQPTRKLLAAVASSANVRTPSPKDDKQKNLPQSASKIDHLRQRQNRIAVLKNPFRLKRLGYDPFLLCKKHAVCVARSKLSDSDLRKGFYHCVDPRSGKAPKLEQAFAKDGTPYLRSNRIEEMENGMANLMQLHMIRAVEHRELEKRPLLHPNVNTSVTINPIHRILQSKRFYCGSFFEPDGSCQTKRCILICFPKNHRGDVRLQMKIWQKKDPQDEGSVSTRKDDIKAHLLSYLCWLYSLSRQSPKELGQWPTGLHCRCDFGHRAKPQDENAEFLCINPFHYVPANELGDEEESIKKRIDDISRRVRRCLKDEPVVAGEKPNKEPNDGNCRCYCQACRCDWIQGRQCDSDSSDGN